MTSAERCDPVEPLLDLGDARRIGVERVREAMEVARDVAETDDDVPELRGGGLELRREPLERGERPLRRGGERAGAIAVVRVECRDRSRSALAELRDVTGALALRTQCLLFACRDALGVLDQRRELLEPGALGIGPPLELVPASRRRLERPPRLACVRSPGPLVGPREGVEEFELVRRSREAPLRELPGEREEALGPGDDVLARDAAAPGVRPRAAIRRDAARDDETGLVVRAEVAKRLEALLVEEPLRNVELGLDVCLAAVGADRGGVPLRAEQEPDRLRDDRLPRAGLAGERDEPRCELELGLADEDEVLDPQSTQHRR